MERCFRTVKEKFFNCLDWNSFTSVEQIQEEYNEFLNSEYNNQVHSSIGVSPKERFMSNFSKIVRKTDDEIEEYFLHRETRKVKKDATISFKDNIYEVPQAFIKKLITIKYKAGQYEELYIYNDKDERVCSIKPVDKILNAKMKRQEQVNMYRKEEN